MSVFVVVLGLKHTHTPELFVRKEVVRDGAAGAIASGGSRPGA